MSSAKQRSTAGWQDACLNCVFLGMVLLSAIGLIYVLTR
jgi:hypothetical protein